MLFPNIFQSLKYKSNVWSWWHAFWALNFIYFSFQAGKVSKTLGKTQKHIKGVFKKSKGSQSWLTIIFYKRTDLGLIVNSFSWFQKVMCAEAWITCTNLEKKSRVRVWNWKPSNWKIVLSFRSKSLGPQQFKTE